MLKVAEKWLRDEIAQRKRLQEGREEAAGQGAIDAKAGGGESFLNAGGFAPGRMLTHYA